MIKSKSELVVFDFDKTLTYKDSLIGFFCYCSSGKYLKLKNMLANLLKIVEWLGLINNLKLKSLFVYLYLKGTSKKVIEQKSKEFAKSIHFNKLYYDTYMKKYYDSALVISASFDEFLVHIVPKKNLLASKLKYDKKENVIGVENNLFGVNKVYALNEINIYKVDLLYTDSFSDKPLMDISNSVILVKDDNVKLYK